MSGRATETSQDVLERTGSALSDSVANVLGTAGEVLTEKLGPALDSAASRGRRARKRARAQVKRQARQRRRQLETATRRRTRQLTKAANRAKHRVQQTGLDVADAVADRSGTIMAATQAKAGRTSSNRARPVVALLALVAVGTIGAVVAKRAKAAPPPSYPLDEAKTEVGMPR